MIETVVGAAGLVMLLAAYFLLEFGHLGKKSAKYNLLNLIGSLALFYYAWALNAPVFAALQVAWMGIAIADLVKKHR
jgi:hypothetical protein